MADDPETPRFWKFEAKLATPKSTKTPPKLQLRKTDVLLGSPSENELCRGDVLLGINNYDASNLTHMEAHDIIKSTGNQLSLLIHRLPGAPQSPYCPTAKSNVHPLSNITPTVTKQPMFSPVPAKTDYYQQPNEIRSWTPPQQQTSFSPIHGFQPVNPPKPQSVENKMKPSVNQPYFMQKLPSRTAPSTTPIESPLKIFPEANSPQLINLQYNSPLGLYSKEALAETLNAHQQASFQPKNRPRSPLPAINIKQTPDTNNGSPTSPSVTSPSALSPAKPGTKLTNIVDITLSPTFQMIQEAENRPISPRPESRTPPYHVRTPTTSISRCPSNCYQDSSVNAFGSPREVIHQSGSFKTLMATLSLNNNQEL